MKFIIDNTFKIEAEVEKGCKARVSHLWDENGNCFQDKIGVARWAEIKASCEFMLKDSAAKSIQTESGLTLHRG